MALRFRRKKSQEVAQQPARVDVSDDEVLISVSALRRGVTEYQGRLATEEARLRQTPPDVLAPEEGETNGVPVIEKAAVVAGQMIALRNVEQIVDGLQGPRSA